MYFIGDIHGDFDTYRKLTAENDQIECSLQVGDMGIFREPDVDLVPGSPNHKFIRGNHDNPTLCKDHPNYLGDYGYAPTPEIFYVSGGYSVDYRSRTPGVDWWHDEELTYPQMHEALGMYLDIRPRIVVSHECPIEAKEDVLGGYPTNITSNTERLLQRMLEGYRPELWIFGHHHRPVERTLNGTHFVCLGDIKYGPASHFIYEVPGLTW